MKTKKTPRCPIAYTYSRGSVRAPSTHGRGSPRPRACARARARARELAPELYRILFELGEPYVVFDDVLGNDVRGAMLEDALALRRRDRFGPSQSVGSDGVPFDKDKINGLPRGGTNWGKGGHDDSAKGGYRSSYDGNKGGTDCSKGGHDSSYDDHD